MSDLHEEDIVLWSERQGELLRRRAAGELINEAELDWPNIAEEIESVGNEQRLAVEALFVQAIAEGRGMAFLPGYGDLARGLDALPWRRSIQVRPLNAATDRCGPYLSPGSAGRTQSRRRPGRPSACAGLPVYAGLAAQ